MSRKGVPPLAGEGLGETHAVAVGLADVGVVQEPKARGFADSWWWKSRNLHVLKRFAVQCGASSRDLAAVCLPEQVCYRGPVERRSGWAAWT